MKRRQADKIIVRFLEDSDYEPRGNTLIKAANNLMPFGTEIKTDAQRIRLLRMMRKLGNKLECMGKGAMSYVQLCGTTPNIELANERELLLLLAWLIF